MTSSNENIAWGEQARARRDRAMSAHHKITVGELTAAMAIWIPLASQVGPNARQQMARKGLEYCPQSGAFKITADRRSPQYATTREQAVELYNGIVLGRLK